MLTNNITLTINEHDTLRPLGTYLRPFTNSVHDIKYHKQCLEYAPYGRWVQNGYIS